MPQHDRAQVNDLLVLRQGGREQLWIATFGSGLWRLDEHGLQPYPVTAGGEPSRMFYRLAHSTLADGDSVLWAASRAGLVRIHGDSVRVLDQQHGMPSNVVRDLTAWRSPAGTQVLWLATERGISRTVLGGGPWHTVSLLGAGATGVFASYIEPDGRGGERLWVGAMGAPLARYESGRWQLSEQVDGVAANSVRLIKPTTTAAGVATLWFGPAGGELVRRNGLGKFEHVATPWPKGPQQAVLDVAQRRFDGADELWVATRQAGLYRWRAGTWSAQAPAGAPAVWGTRGLTTQIDRRGHAWLWASTSIGLIRHDGRQARIVALPTPRHAAEQLGINLLDDGARQVLWIGSAHGLLRVDVSDPLQPQVLDDDLPPPPDPYVYGALRDSQGRVYLCTNNGVQQLIATASGYRSHVFTRRDGMPHEECNHNAQFLDAHDRLWVGTLGGLGVYDPAQEDQDREAKPLRITAVRSGGAALAPDHVVLPPGSRDLEVKFALLSWHNEDASLFRSQLVGDERDATPWTRHNARNFGRLPPGRYLLHVEARDYAGNPSPAVELPIRVLPAWWQTLPARIAALLGVAMLLYLLLQQRTRTLQRRQRELENIVAARTIELHTANARLTELSYQDALTGLANRHRLREAFDAALHARDQRWWSLILIDVDHFKAYNDQYGHPAGDEALRAVAAAMQSCAPREALLVRYGGEEFACLLPGLRLAQARDIAERVRIDVAARSVPVPGESVVNHVTISVGIGERLLNSPADAHRLLRDADQALYRAKAAGRNRVMQLEP